MSTSDELARWRAARAKTKSVPNSPASFRPSPMARRPVEPAPEVEEYRELLEGCTSVQVESISGSAEGSSRDHSVAKAVDGSGSSYYCTTVDAAQLAEVQILLAGRFNIRKIDIRWKYPPANFQIQFSRWDGERFEWLPVVEKTAPDGQETQQIFIGNAGFAHSSGAVKILMRPDEYEQLGISDIQLFGQKALIAPRRIEASSNYSK